MKLFIYSIRVHVAYTPSYMSILYMHKKWTSPWRHFDLLGKFPQSIAFVSAGEFAASDLNDVTFTLSNIGSIGGTYTSPIINPPQVG